MCVFVCVCVCARAHARILLNGETRRQTCMFGMRACIRIDVYVYSVCVCVCVCVCLSVSVCCDPLSQVLHAPKTS